MCGRKIEDPVFHNWIVCANNKSEHIGKRFLWKNVFQHVLERAPKIIPAICTPHFAVYFALFQSA